jgi:cell division protein FtsQ
LSAKKKPLRKNTFKAPQKTPLRRLRLGLRIRPMLIGLGFTTVLAGLALGLMVAYSALTRTTMLRAKMVAVTGCQRLSENDVLRQAGIYRGDNIFAINLNVARQRLLAHPWISGADVIREVPDGILVRIREHRALAMVEMNNKRYLMNTRGEIFKHYSGETDALPVISGFSPEDIQVAGRQPMKHETNPHKSVMNIVKLAQDPDGRLPLSQIKQILVDREIGLTLLSEGPARTIRLGYGDYDPKLDRLMDVRNYLKQQADLVIFDSIDLNHINRIVVKPMAAEAGV